MQMLCNLEKDLTLLFGEANDSRHRIIEERALLSGQRMDMWESPLANQPLNTKELRSYIYRQE
jgi:hypothetical protein